MPHNASERTLTLGHSPDPDDAFMFYGLACGAIATPGLHFEHILQDIQTLNERALREELDTTAISIHAYASVLDKYALLPCGASMGDNYGPIVVSVSPFRSSELRNKRIAIPGRMTSAFLALKIYLGTDKFDYDVVPFDKIIEHVKEGHADCGLLIHEGQLTYEAEGLRKIVDLGEWWFERTRGLPLPLGANVVRKALGHDLMLRVKDYMNQSIAYGLEHRAPALKHSMQWGRGLDVALTDRFVGMYVNELTRDFGERGRSAVKRFLDEAHRLKFIAAPVELEFV